MSVNFRNWALAGGLALAFLGANATSAQEMRTVTDLAGNEVSIPAEVTKVGTNYPAVNQMLFMLGGSDRLVATNRGAGQSLRLLVEMYPPQGEVPELFGSGVAEVNLEELTRNPPEVVFLTQGASTLIEPLARIGVKGVMLQSFTNPDAVKAGVRLVAEVLGGDAPERAERFVEYYDNQVAFIQSRTANIPFDERPRAYYTAATPLTTEGDTIVKTWMEQAGGVNVAAENGIPGSPTFAPVTLEDVIAWQPDWIICRDPGTRQEILDDPRWRSIPAVQNDHVVINPKSVFVWSVRSAEAALQPLWAAKLFHPDLFEDVDNREVIRDFYRDFYDYELSEEQLDRIFNPA